MQCRVVGSQRLACQSLSFIAAAPTMEQLAAVVADIVAAHGIDISACPLRISSKATSPHPLHM